MIGLAPGDAPHLYIEVSRADAATVLTLRGEIDVYTVPRLRSSIQGALDHGAKNLIVNLEALEFTDSQGLGALMAGWKLARSNGGALLLAAVPKQVAKALAITGLVRYLKAFPDTAAALAHLKRTEAA